MTLNQQQQKAVELTERAVLIIAGAGTGKSTTIVQKIKHIVSKHLAKPDEILALTFSNEAANHFREKIFAEIPNSENLKCSTFHAFCANIIRDNASKCEVSLGFRILQEIDIAILLHNKLKIDPSTAREYSASITKVKDLNLTLDDYKRYVEDQKQLLIHYCKNETDFETKYKDCVFRLNTFHLTEQPSKEDKIEKKSWEEYVELYLNYVQFKDFYEALIKYEEVKKEVNALDYGDLNHIVLKFVDKFDYSFDYKYVIVDEFQDTNYVQFELLKRLAKNNQNITVVGDTNQTIYAFRGAYTNNIDAFKQYFKLSQNNIITLDTNYRSYDNILKVSHKLISKNFDNPEEAILLKSIKKEDGDKVRIFDCKTGDEEARKITDMIEQKIKEGIPMKEIAVLYRTHSQSKYVKKVLELRGIPFIESGGIDLLSKPEIRTLLSYLYVINNFENPNANATQAWWRLFHYNNYLDEHDSLVLAEYVKKSNKSLQYVIYNRLDKIEFSEKGKALINKIKSHIKKIAESKNKITSEIVFDVLEHSGLNRYYSVASDIKSKEALMSIRDFLNIIKDFEEFHSKELSDFISYLEIINEMDYNPTAEKINDDNSVRLMTIHASKGLEFDVVFLINLAKEKFPLYRGQRDKFIPLELDENYKPLFQQEFTSKKKREESIKDHKKIMKRKEERRLCYVAMTRAKKELYLTLAQIYGQGKEREASEFLFDIGYNNWRQVKNYQDENLSYELDEKLEAKDLVPDKEIDRIRNKFKMLLLQSLDNSDIEESMKHLLYYHGLKQDFEVMNILEIIKPHEIMKNVQEIVKNNTLNNKPKFNSENFEFSISGINTYDECPKKFELSSIYRLPNKMDFDKNSATSFGKFIHKVCEVCSQQKPENIEQVMEIAKSLSEEIDWTGVDLERAEQVLNVFWERNKNTIKDCVEVEKRFLVNIGDFKFKGFIDRIDKTDEGFTIIDYKTGKNEPGKTQRSRQLSLYAYAYQKMKPDTKVVKCGLELLEKEKPRMFTIDGDIMNGEGREKPILISETIEEIRQIAESIKNDYNTEFKPVEDDAPCHNCSYKFYCPKWG